MADSASCGPVRAAAGAGVSTAGAATGGGGLGGGEVGVGQLGNATLRSLELLLQILVLHLQGVDGGDNLIEELINLVLVVTLAELDVLELLVEDILGSEQGHFFASRSFRLDARNPHAWTTGKAARYHVTKIITEIVTLATSITRRGPILWGLSSRDLMATGS